MYFIFVYIIMCCWNEAVQAQDLLAGYYAQLESNDDWEFIEYVDESTPNASQINMKIFIQNQERTSWIQGINYFR